MLSALYKINKVNQKKTENWSIIGWEKENNAQRWVSLENVHHESCFQADCKGNPKSSRIQC